MQRESSIRKPSTSNGRDVELGRYDQTPQYETVIPSTTSQRLMTIEYGSGLRIVAQNISDFDVLIKAEHWRPKHSALATEAKALFRAITQRLITAHQNIEVNEEVLAGTPHIKGSRLSVAHILSELHHQGSIDAVAKKFSDFISENQVRDAIAYAHDFMETACDLSEDDD